MYFSYISTPVLMGRAAKCTAGVATEMAMLVVLIEYKWPAAVSRGWRAIVKI